MTYRPCVECGAPFDGRGPRCSACLPTPAMTTTERGYDNKWRRLSERARRLQPFCSTCGSTENLTTDHLPSAWERREAGLEIRLVDVDVLCRDCNTDRGSSRPGSTRASS